MNNVLIERRDFTNDQGEAVLGETFYLSSIVADHLVRKHRGRGVKILMRGDPFGITKTGYAELLKTWADPELEEHLIKFLEGDNGRDSSNSAVPNSHIHPTKKGFFGGPTTKRVSI